MCRPGTLCSHRFASCTGNGFLFVSVSLFTESLNKGVLSAGSCLGVLAITILIAKIRAAQPGSDCNGKDRSVFFQHVTGPLTFVVVCS